METDRNYFIVGLFIIIMVLACVGFTIWLTSTRNEGYDRYLIHFLESVSGLSKESAVKFRGVDIGSVEEIGIDPKDSKLVKVIIRVRKSTPVKADTTATLKLHGITGEVYIDLSGGSEHAKPIEARKGQLPEIRAIPSSISTILNSMPKFLDKANHIADQISKIFSEENVMAISRVARKLGERYGIKESHKKHYMK